MNYYLLILLTTYVADGIIPFYNEHKGEFAIIIGIGALIGPFIGVSIKKIINLYKSL